MNKKIVLIIFIVASISIIFSSCKDENNVVVQPPDPPVQNLILFLPFNGNANDESGNNNHATTVNAVLTTDRFGKIDSAYSFNGIDDFIMIPNSSSLSSTTTKISICAWVYINTWYDSRWAPICAKSNTSSHAMYGINLTNFTNSKQIEFQLNFGYRKYNYSFGTGSWYFVVTTWDGNNCKYYVNGSFIGSVTYSANITADTRPLVLGAETSEVSEYLDGKLDDFRIYDYAISDQAVDSLYHIGGW